ncbi:signal transduction histidine kinase [Sphingobium sp. ba1]|jgi:signal transduction histidine kinase|uniref:response regulator n=1 Tax=Sphingobium sp. ba1 TaxID=1522072 RepID=UPI000505D2A5|nr:response regulator [Sphingobium sp. ba1]KFL45143.1 signal transduction histidine kinase [Sphingobium sp. ba1]
METLLAKQDYACTTCTDARALSDELVQGAATAIITEESLAGADRSALDAWVAQQPPWSDFPFILLATRRAGHRPRDAMLVLERLGNVIVLERPIHSETLGSAVRSAMRVRRRQYEARERLAALQLAEERLTHLNANLETRIAERTSELSRANNMLMEEVAERERAQTALVQSQKMEAVGQLTCGIAHDFNNLLTVVSGNLEMIERRSDDERILRHARFAAEATDRAAKLTRQLLAFSRTQQLALAPLSLNALVEGMSDLLARTIGPRIDQRRSLAASQPWVMADMHQLELAVLNLAINARDAMPEGGILTIETDAGPSAPEGVKPGRYGVVRVRDNGVGIPRPILSKVFDPFYTTKPLGKGTGLGLSQVFGIARQSGGIAQIDSVEQEGTTVSIWLPLAEQPVVDTELVAQISPSDRVRAKLNILVVDDDEGVRRFVAEGLESFGYHITQAASGAEAVTMLDAELPDVMIVDFAMPGMTGIELAEDARRRASDLPIIMVTGYAEEGVSADTSLITHIVRKPFKIDALVGVLDMSTGMLASAPD